ncbi:WecB/TagA/CpsF family glycosyltransferase [Cochlodiniinecator piscidefendens]|uniref:WecB/TagA/CpsF family glycosyltransferase n=1 Tax=Cochlodiniinecator piscidefendens TaxID=2715756 RepID=UPI0014075614
MEFTAGARKISVNVATQSELWTEVDHRFQAGEGFALATLNLDHLVKLRDSAEFHAAYCAQDLVVADGNPIVWISRVAGEPVDLLPGADLVLPLVEHATQAGVSIALLGSTEQVLDAAAEHLETRVAGCQVVCKIAPKFGFDPEGSDAAGMFDALNASGAGLCLVALGAPKQEIFAARGRRLSPQIGFASIGAGVDFLAGEQKRAPKWVRKLAIEWLWRLLSNPKRLFGRYFKCVVILPGHFLRALRQRYK